ncbi:MAG: protein TolR [Deltaproteobacteria bacterium]|nr:protein TolR [Deltaproteobacteria bacterium]
MAMGSFDSDQGGRPGMMSEINVTPMVDVMLVLLIIFMVAAPMMTQGLEVDLPKVDAKAMRTDQNLVVLTVLADGRVLLDETALGTIDNLDAQVREVMRTKNTESLFLKADQAVPYGRVAAIMGALREAGITNVGLVTDPADRSQPAVFPAQAGQAGAPGRTGTF